MLKTQKSAPEMSYLQRVDLCMRFHVTHAEVHIFWTFPSCLVGQDIFLYY